MTIANVIPRFSDSPCWKSLLQVKNVYFAGRRVSLRRGNIVCLGKIFVILEDPCDAGSPLCDLFLELFSISQAVLLDLLWTRDIT
jgi:hypothetical protein